MATMLSSRNSNLSQFNAVAINYSTLTGSTITASSTVTASTNLTTIQYARNIVASTIQLNTSTVSIGSSTNQVYTVLSQGNFSTSTNWVSTLTGQTSTTGVSISANAQTQLVVSQTSSLTSVQFTSTIGAQWTSLNRATGLPSSLTPVYSAGAISGNGQYGILAAYGSYLYTTANGGASWTNTNPNTPAIYLPFETVPANGSSSSGSAPATLTVVGPPTTAPSYQIGSGAIRLANSTTGGNATQYIRGSWTVPSNFSVSLWFNLQGTSSSNLQFIFSSGTSNNTNATILYISVNNSALTLQAPGNVTIATPYSIALNTWYNVFFTIQSNGTCSFYVNNILVGTVISTATALSTGNFGLGTYDAGGSLINAFSGYLDDVKIYNSAITFTPMMPQNWSNVAVSNSGQYMLATATGAGLYLSSNYGSTWTQVTSALLSAVWSAAQVSATGQYLLAYVTPVIVQPQLTGLPSSGTALTTSPWQTGGVTWIASTSSVLSGYPVSAAFNNTASNPGWVCAGSTYTTASPGVYTGVASTTVIGQGAVVGEYIQLQSSTQLQMISYSIGAAGYQQFPNTYTIAGSNDNVTWYLIQSVTMNQNPSGTTDGATPTSSIIVNQSGYQTYSTSVGSATLTCTISVYTTNAYSYFRFIINKPWNNGTPNNNAAGFSEWNINFQAGGQTYSTNYGSTWNNGYALSTQSTLSLSGSGQYALSQSSTISISPQQTGLISNSWNQGGVAWTATASISNTPAQGPFNAFSGSYPVGWVGALGAYRNGSPFDYTAGTYSTAITGITPSPTGGDWLQIQSSIPLIMISYTFASSGVLQQPQKYYIVGSNDNSTWYPIQLANGTVNPLTTANTACSSYLSVSTSTTPTAQTIQGNTAGSYTTTGYAGSLNTYTYFRIVVTNTWGYTNGNTNIGQWFINFTGPTNTSLYNIVSPLTGFSTNTYSSGTIPGVITNSAVSNTGQYMVIVTNNTSGNNVYYSTNYGATFTGLTLGSLAMTSAAISYDGSYITVANATTVYQLNNNSNGYTVALGNNAGQQNQGQNAIAIGNYAGYQNQTANSIILNASGQGTSGLGLNSYTNGFYVAPIASYLASSSPSFSLLAYGSDNQVVQTGITVASGATTSVSISGTLTLGTIVAPIDAIAQGIYLTPNANNSSTILQYIQKVVTTVTATAGVSPWWMNSYTYGTTGSTSGSYIGGVLLPDGRVLFVPNTATTIGIYNPTTNVFSTTGSTPGNIAYMGGVLLPDGRVVFVPNYTTSIGIYNPTTNTYSTTGSSITGYRGGVLLPDGRVLFVPGSATSIGIYNPTTNVFSTTGSASGYTGGVLLPDGRVVFVPTGATSIGIYNPTTNVFSTTGSTSGAYEGGVLLPDGRVLFVPNTATTIGIYNPTTNTYFTTGTTPGNYAYTGGVVLPDGRVVFVPNYATSIGIYNPTTNTYSTTGSTSGNGAYEGGVLLPDGRVLFVPLNATSIGIFATGLTTPREMCLSPYFNKF